MKKQSAGIILYRFKNIILEILLVHPGGPFWAKKDAGSWSIPKGEFSESENAFETAKREFNEETGMTLEGEEYTALAPIKQKSGKIVYCWAIEGDLDPNKIISNTFEIEWPPKSGLMKKFPEIDKGAWFSVPMAREKINSGQAAFIEELITKLNLSTDKLINTTEEENKNGSQLDLF